MLNTFLRSAAQATDSTLIGCSANKAATMRLRQRNPVALCSRQNSRTAFTACSSTLTAWCPTGFSPKRVQSRAWESHVRGCQLAAS